MQRCHDRLCRLCSHLSPKGIILYVLALQPTAIASVSPSFFSYLGPHLAAFLQLLTAHVSLGFTILRGAQVRTESRMCYNIKNLRRTRQGPIMPICVPCTGGAAYCWLVSRPRRRVLSLLLPNRASSTSFGIFEMLVVPLL